MIDIKEKDIRNMVLSKYEDMRMSHHWKRQANYDLFNVCRKMWVKKQITDEQYYKWAYNELFDVPSPGMTNRIKWYIERYKARRR